MMKRLLPALLLLAASAAVTVAQDIRGLEVCTAEKSMERRTGCLQANVEFLQKELTKLKRDSDAKLTVSQRELAAAKADIAALKAALAKLTADVAALHAKSAPAKK